MIKRLSVLPYYHQGNDQIPWLGIQGLSQTIPHWSLQLLSVLSNALSFRHAAHLSLNRHCLLRLTCSLAWLSLTFIWGAVALTQLTHVHSSNPRSRVAWSMKWPWWSQATLDLPSSVLSWHISHASKSRTFFFFFFGNLVFCHCSPVKCVLLRGDYIFVHITQIGKTLLTASLTDGMLHLNEHCQEWEKSLAIMPSIFAHLFIDLFIH